MFTAEQIANWFLSRESMTPKKLQKLCYYAYAWGLVFFNEDVTNIKCKLFGDKIEAWVHGPVIPTIYQKYRDYGYNNIPASATDNRINNTDVENLLSQVWEAYGKYDGNQLESITHQEKPWIEARGNCNPLDLCTNQINDVTMFSYYGSR